MGLAQLSNAHNVDSGEQTPLGDSNDGPSGPLYDACACNHEGDVNIAELTLPEKNHDSKIKMSSDMFPGDECPENGIKVSSDDAPLHILETSQVDRSFTEELNLIRDQEDVSRNSETDFGNVESHPERSSADGNSLVDETALLSVDDVTVQPSESTGQLVEGQDSNLDNSNARLLVDTASNPENTSNIVGAEDELTNLNATMSPSSLIHTIDVIEEIIVDARNNKVPVILHSIVCYSSTKCSLETFYRCSFFKMLVQIKPNYDWLHFFE